MLHGGVDQRDTIQLDHQPLADVGRGHIGEDFGAFVGQLEADCGMTVFIERVAGGLNHVAGHELISVGIQETHLGGSTDQVQH